MEKFEFVQQTRYNETDSFYFTEQNGKYISDSGHYNKEKAYEKFIFLSQGGSLDPVKITLEIVEIDNPKSE